MFNSNRQQLTMSTIKAPIELRLGSLIATTARNWVTDRGYEELAARYIEKLDNPIMPMNSAKNIISKRRHSGSFMGFLFQETGFKEINFKEANLKETNFKQNELCGFIVANLIEVDLYSVSCLSMDVFNVSLKGILAAKGVMLLHRLLIAQAKKLNVEYALTSSFYKDKEHKMNKILELDGWHSDGYYSAYKINKDGAI